jgi:hypothetical protein
MSDYDLNLGPWINHHCTGKNSLGLNSYYQHKDKYKDKHNDKCELLENLEEYKEINHAAKILHSLTRLTK